ncbi:MAG: hypothetical protein WD992_02810 [Candidatus Levyibacteriota bacterium]
MNSTLERSRLTAEQMSGRMAEIFIIREQKGKEQEALDLIRATREDALALSLHSHVVDLYWEECLIANHMIMNGNNADGRAVYKAAAEAADAYIEEHNVENRRPRSHRFLGEAFMLEGNYKEAALHFMEGLNLFEDSSDPIEWENTLELRGMLSEALIRSGEKEDGLGEGFHAFTDFDEYGKELKSRDYYTWAIWKSGVVIRMWNAILDGNAELSEEQKAKLLLNLDEAEEIISVPRSSDMLGDFSYRKDEVSRIRKRLATR